MPIDYTGRRQGRLVGIRKLAKKDSLGRTLWEMKCDCGRTIERPGVMLLRNRMTSCTSKGFDGEEPSSCPLGKTHGASVGDKDFPEYRSWLKMRTRCFAKSGKHKKLYVDRGITICKRWQDFANFFADMGTMPVGKNTIDRINTHKGYWCGRKECDECRPLRRKNNGRWANRKEQANNTSRCIWVRWKGKKQNLRQWADELGFIYGTLQARYRKGWRGKKLFGPIRTLEQRRVKKNGRFKSG